MLLAALGTVGYRLSLDKLAAETVQQNPATAARSVARTSISPSLYLPYLHCLLKFNKGKNEILEPTTWKLAIPAASLNFCRLLANPAGLTS